MREKKRRKNIQHVGEGRDGKGGGMKRGEEESTVEEKYKYKIAIIQYLINSNNISQKRQKLNLDGNKIHINLLIKISRQPKNTIT